MSGSNLVRPLTGERPKHPTSISLDPEVWKTFKRLVEAKQPDGDKSASAHLETVIRRENARLTGKAEAVNAEALQRLLHNQKQKLQSLQRQIGAERLERFNKAAQDYGMAVDFSNYADVIRRALRDSKKNEDTTPVQQIMPKQKPSGFSLDLNRSYTLLLFIQLLELNAEISKAEAELSRHYDGKFNS